MQLPTRILRLLVAAVIGAGIALLLYLFLLQWMHWAFEKRISRWMVVVVDAALFGLFYYGSKYLIRKAKG